MAVRLRRSTPTPTVGTAGTDLAKALNDLTTATGRWLALQPAVQEVPAYAERARQASSQTLEHAGDWAEATAARAKDTTSRAASTVRTALVNLGLVAVLLWWVGRRLNRDQR